LNFAVVYVGAIAEKDIFAFWASLVNSGESGKYMVFGTTLRSLG
jgi:hypothetical protein